MNHVPNEPCTGLWPFGSEALAYSDFEIQHMLSLAQHLQRWLAEAIRSMEHLQPSSYIFKTFARLSLSEPSAMHRSSNNADHDGNHLP